MSAFALTFKSSLSATLIAYLVLHILLLCLRVTLCWEKENNHIDTSVFPFKAGAERQKKRWFM